MRLAQQPFQDVDGIATPHVGRHPATNRCLIRGSELAPTEVVEQNPFDMVQAGPGELYYLPIAYIITVGQTETGHGRGKDVQ